MLLATLVPRLIGFRACIPRTLSATLSSSSDSSESSIPPDNSRSLRLLSLDEALQLNDPTAYQHAAHCLLYCKIIENEVEGIFGLGQMRFDGQLGFPGGKIVYEELKEVKSLIKGLERELKEEINYCSKLSESLNDETSGYTHISTYIDDSVIQSDPPSSMRTNVYHFFVKQISEQDFVKCETAHTQSIHFPMESLGLFRIPLIDPSNCSDQTVFRYYKNRGGFLCNFFKHYFAGLAKNQLYDALVFFDCLTPDCLAKLKRNIYKINP